jgi:hypothetical protein
VPVHEVEQAAEYYLRLATLFGREDFTKR